MQANQNRNGNIELPCLVTGIYSPGNIHPKSYQLTNQRILCKVMGPAQITKIDADALIRPKFLHTITPLLNICCRQGYYMVLSEKICSIF